LSFLPTTRRGFLRIAASTAIVAIAAESAVLEPNHPQVVRRDIVLRRWPERLDGFTIALLSDFHYDPYFSVHPLRAAIPMVNDLHPDLIVLAGDFVCMPLVGNNDEKAAAAAEPCADLLHALQARHGVRAILGNHDFFTDPRRVARALRDRGIEVLINQSVAIERDGARFWLSGIDDVIGEVADLTSALHGIPADEATILLAHEPDYADHVVRSPVDLQLSGHSHGGQVRFPFLPPVYLPTLGKKYVAGLYKVGPLTVYTSVGLGTVVLPLRWNCPPEVNFLTIRRG
jgi:predicted MPP superfamily phosphohydrolase